MAIGFPEKQAVFWVMLSLAVAFAGVELYLVVAIAQTGDYMGLRTVVAALNALVVAGALGLVKALFRREFLQRETITGQNLTECHRARAETIEHWLDLSDEEQGVSATISLMRSNLHFLERVLRDLYGDHEYEMSVFYDREHPRVVCYHDSGGHILPASHAAREDNPDYYKDECYEVVELLEHPEATPRVIANTRARGTDYSFTDEEQREDVGSSVLYSIPPDSRAALVIACSKSGTFSNRDPRLRVLASAIGAAVGADLKLRSRVSEV